MISIHTTKKYKVPLISASLLLCLVQFSSLAIAGDEGRDSHSPSSISDVMSNLPSIDASAFAGAATAGVSFLKGAVESINFTEVALSRGEWLRGMGEKANAAIDNANWPLAELTLTQMLAEYPSAHDVRLKLASMFSERGALERASQLLQKGIELAPDYPSLRYALADLLASEKRYDSALNVLDGLTPPLIDSQEYFSLKAEMARRGGKCAQAIPLYTQLLEQRDAGALWLGLGICQRQLGLDFETSFLKAQSSSDLGAASQEFIKKTLEGAK